MLFQADLTHRRKQPEIMDEPDLDERRHFHALRGLERINFFSRSAGILWPAIAALAREDTRRPVRVLDIATGGGDVPMRLARKAQRANLPIQFTGCDRSPQAVRYAQQTADRKGAAVRFFALDVLAEAIPSGHDVLCCSLFLHHLEEDQAVALLRNLASAAGRLVLVNDLVRSPAGFALAWLGTRVLSRSPVVHVDGPRSVEGAFTLDEALALARRAGMKDAAIARRWPFRFLLTWRRP